MNGIKILSENVMYSNSSVVFLIIVIDILIIMSISLIITITSKKNTISAILFLSIISIIIGTNFLDNTGILEQKTLYEVAISDDIDFNEFSKKYEIINHKNKIYSVVEK